MAVLAAVTPLLLVLLLLLALLLVVTTPLAVTSSTAGNDDGVMRWAVSQRCSSEHAQFKASNVLGAPDGSHYYPRWATEGDDWLEVKFVADDDNGDDNGNGSGGGALFARGCTIAQNVNPGIVVSVSVHLADGHDEWLQVWHANANDNDEETTTKKQQHQAPELRIAFDDGVFACAAPPRVDALRVELRVARNKGWNGFDAIGLYGTSTTATAIKQGEDACAAVQPRGIVARRSASADYRAENMLVTTDGSGQWCPAHADQGMQYVALRFMPIALHGITVLQGKNPGAIVSLAVRSTLSDWIVVWERSALSDADLARIDFEQTRFSPTLQCVPSILVSELRIRLDTAAVVPGGWNCLDTALLHGSGAASSSSSMLPVCPHVSLYAQHVDKYRNIATESPTSFLLGRPDHQLAYANAEEFWQSSHGIDFFELSFTRAIYVSDVTIAQVDGPGTVCRVQLERDGKWVSVYEHPLHSPFDQHTEIMFTIPLTCAPRFLTRRVRFEIDTQLLHFVNGFDSVRVRGSPLPDVVVHATHLEDC
jgi:hypothetical protein